MKTIPCLAVTFQSSLSSLSHSLKEAQMAVAAAGFKNLDKVDASINANRTKVYVYFDYNAEYFPIGLRFMFENGEFTFHSLGVYEQGLEPIADMEEARERWNEWTSEATK